MAKDQNQGKEQQAIPKVQRAYSTNPLAEPTPEERKELDRQFMEIRKVHQKTQQFVRTKFQDEPKPVWIDKGN